MDGMVMSERSFVQGANQTKCRKEFELESRQAGSVGWCCVYRWLGWLKSNVLFADQICNGISFDAD
jgi:hypothetical protein